MGHRIIGLWITIASTFIMLFGPLPGIALAVLGALFVRLRLSRFKKLDPQLTSPLPPHVATPKLAEAFLAARDAAACAKR